MAFLRLHGTAALTGEAVVRATVAHREKRGYAPDITALVAEEAPGLLAYFARRVSPLDDAADLLGDTLLIVWRRKSAIPGDPTRARMWMYGVARKVLSTHRRSSSRRIALADRLRLDLLSLPAVTEPADDSVHEYVLMLLADLEEIDREIMGLVYWEGFSLVEVAHILSMRPATVRSRHSRARAQLKMALEDSGDIRRDRNN